MDTQWNSIYKNKLKKYSYYDVLDPHEDMEEVSQFFKENSVKDILDLGCGAGRNAIFLAKKGFNVSGIDNANEGLLVAQEQATKFNTSIKTLCADIYEPLPYKDNFFDAIISVQVLQHNKRDEIQKTFKEIYRILKPGGFIFITVCGRYSKGKERYCLVKTAKKISKNTYVPTIGDETGLVHFIYNKKLLLSDSKKFKQIKLWKDSKDYYCLLAKK